MAMTPVMAAPTIDGFYRLLFGGMMLLLIALLRRQHFRYNRQSLLFTTLAGLFFALDLVFWHQSIEYIGPGLATIIVNLQVFALAFVGIVVFRETVSWKFYLAIPIAVIGMYMLIGDDWAAETANYRFGVVLCFIALLNYTIYLFALRKSQSLTVRAPTIANLAVISLFGAAITGVIAIFQGVSFAIPTLQDGV